MCANLYLQPTHSKEKLAKNDTGHTGNEISFCTHAFQCGRPARLSWLVLFPHELLCDLSALRLLQEAHMHTHTHTHTRAQTQPHHSTPLHNMSDAGSTVPTHSTEQLAKNDTGQTGNEISFTRTQHLKPITDIANDTGSLRAGSFVLEGFLHRT